jgi:hypothetical protein
MPSPRLSSPPDPVPGLPFLPPSLLHLHAESPWCCPSVPSAWHTGVLRKVDLGLQDLDLCRTGTIHCPTHLCHSELDIGAYYLCREGMPAMRSSPGYDFKDTWEEKGQN